MLRHASALVARAKIQGHILFHVPRSSPVLNVIEPLSRTIRRCVSRGNSDSEPAGSVSRISLRRDQRRGNSFAGEYSVKEGPTVALLRLIEPHKSVHFPENANQYLINVKRTHVHSVDRVSQVNAVAHGISESHSSSRPGVSFDGNSPTRKCLARMVKYASIVTSNTPLNRLRVSLSRMMVGVVSEGDVEVQSGALPGSLPTHRFGPYDRSRNDGNATKRSCTSRAVSNSTLHRSRMCTVGDKTVSLESDNVSRTDLRRSVARFVKMGKR